MKLKFKKSAFAPLLIILFLLITSAVTSYVVINQGTGGYKTRAGWGIPDLDCKLVGGKIPISCGGGKITGSFSTPTPKPKATPTPRPSCATPGVACCPGGNNGSQGIPPYCQGGLFCISGKCSRSNSTPTPTPRPNTCATKAPNSCGYMNRAGCPDGVVYCTGGSTCIDPATGKGPAEGKKGKCVDKPTITPTPTTKPYNPNPQPPVGGGTSSCEGGIWCDEAPTTYTGAAGEIVCGQRDTGGTCRDWQCNGSTGTWSYLGNACNPRTPAVPPTETPVGTGDVTLEFTLRLQGVTGIPKGSKTVPFKVKLKGSSDEDYVTGTLTAGSSGKWTGSTEFKGIPVGADTNYAVYVKVGKHFQKKVCVLNPTESSGGQYSCKDGVGLIPLTAGTNPLDFSGISQLVGDLPTESGEQNGRVDSYDKGFLLNNQRSTDPAKLQIGDLNFDGIIDTADWSLILQSLNVKYDDE